MILVLVLPILALALTPNTQAQQDPFFGQLIYTYYYEDETYTGIPCALCEYNTCTGVETCNGPKTIYAYEVNRVTIGCDGFIIPPN
jgi:hypothetical protein